jgi:hypothetical protein
METEKATGYRWANVDRRRPGYQAPFPSLSFFSILAAALVRGDVIIASALSFSFICFFLRKGDQDSR